LTKTWSALSLGTGVSPIDFENLLLNQNHEMTLGYFTFSLPLFLAIPRQNSGKVTSKSAGL